VKNELIFAQNAFVGLVKRGASVTYGAFSVASHRNIAIQLNISTRHVWVRPLCSCLQNVLNAAARIILRKRSSTTSPRTFEIDHVGCPFSRELNIKCVSWCTRVCIRLHQHTSLNCLNQLIVVRTVAGTQIHLLTYLWSKGSDH